MTPAIEGILRWMSVEPDDGEAYAEWLGQQDVVPFLENEANADLISGY